MNIEIANRLIELRKRRGLSQEALAQELGISRQAVSKWERAESSPDTDNLILLAKLYGVSLDELLKLNDEDVENLKKQSNSNEDKSKDTQNIVHIGCDGIHIVDDDDEIHVGWNGVHIVNKNESDSRFDWGDDIIYDIDGAEKNKRKIVFLDYIPYGIVAIIVFLCLGFIQGVWHPSWLILLTIPIYDSLATVLRKKRISSFNYPLLTTVIFLYIGFEYSVWHPTWTIFLTIPIFYYLIGYFRKFKR